MLTTDEKRLAELVVQRGHAEPGRLDEALAALEERRGRDNESTLGEILVEYGALDDSRLGSLLKLIHFERAHQADSDLARRAVGQGLLAADVAEDLIQEQRRCYSEGKGLKRFRTLALQREALTAEQIGTLRKSREDPAPKPRAVSSPAARGSSGSRRRRRSGNASRDPRDKPRRDPAGAGRTRPRGRSPWLAFGLSFGLGTLFFVVVFRFLGPDSPVPESTPAPPVEPGVESERAFPAPRESVRTDLEVPVNPRSEEPLEPGSVEEAGVSRVDRELGRVEDFVRARKYIEATEILVQLLKSEGIDRRVYELRDEVEAARRADVAAYLNEARERLRQGDRIGARRKVEVVLYWKPGDRDAEDLLERIDAP